MQILRAAERTASPWKNGGGMTWEIAVSPASSGLDDFDWRLSIAEVASGGPFSSFAGVDRILSVLQGEGLQLRIDGREPVVLGASSGPLAFAGDAVCSAELLGGPIRDFNVMVHRDRYAAEVRRLSGPLELNSADALVAALALEASDASGHQLHPEDLVLGNAGEQLLLGSGSYLVVALTAA